MNDLDDLDDLVNEFDGNGGGHIKKTQKSEARTELRTSTQSKPQKDGEEDEWNLFEGG